MNPWLAFGLGVLAGIIIGLAAGMAYGYFIRDNS